ncbi:hypothetical protein WICPIJ_006532 [Wickerhamomyces pijperi]|uniref:VPS37 C-terminal domain-containing protein n=1 Tax=Wickerhamomyces pijperi TaxID=599730 RepID=A0A9P8Q1K0_WICPI|nr:hypothetical protein WICPIJ_006532 [Wickerhamomyces pijperi]
MSAPPSLPSKQSNSNAPHLPPKPNQNILSPTHTPASISLAGTPPSASPALPKKQTPSSTGNSSSSYNHISNSSSLTPSLPPKRYTNSTTVQSTPSPPQPPAKPIKLSYSASNQNITSSVPHQVPQPSVNPPQPVIQDVVPVFPLPEAFTLLPETEMLKLSKSLEILKGFLITQVQPEKQAMIKDLDSKIAQIQSFKVELEEILRRKQETNQSLRELQEKVQRWEIVQATMFSALEKFSPENVKKLMVEAVIDSKMLSDFIEDSFLSSPEGQLDDRQIQAFVNSYTKERTFYYKRREKLARFNERNIHGL